MSRRLDEWLWRHSNVIEACGYAALFVVAVVALAAIWIAE